MAPISSAVVSTEVTISTAMDIVAGKDMSGILALMPSLIAISGGGMARQ